MNYRERSDRELDELPDEALIEQLVAAREAGGMKQASTAMAIFAYRRFGELTYRARLKLASQEDAEDIAQEAMLGALSASFDGRSVGQAVKLMHTIVDRRVADLYRKRDGKETQQLPEERTGDDGPGRDVAISPDDSGVVFAQDTIERVYAKLSKDSHRMVVDLKVFQKYTAKETATMVNEAHPDLDKPMSPNNADKIASRFSEAFRAELNAEAEES